MSTAVSRIALRSGVGARLAAGALAVVVALGVAMVLYDRSRSDRIAKGVTVAGIDVGGLSASAARAKLQRQVAGAMDRPVVAQWQARRWQLDPRSAGVAVDVQASVARALSVSREGSIFTRTWRGLTGGRVSRELPLHVSFSRAQVRAFVLRVAGSVDRAPRDASVQPSASGLSEVADRAGVAVNRRQLQAQLGGVLASMSAGRTLQVPVRTLHPAVTVAQLAARFPAYIVVDRSAFQLRFYSHLKLAETYPIAVGMQGLETPPGLYHIQWKQVNPPWYVPKSAWAGALAGKTIPPGPQDPLKARFMSFDGGAGIHGIDPSEYGSIGHDASHGCVRMRIPDVIALYARTPVGTPVYIA